MTEKFEEVQHRSPDVLLSVGWAFELDRVYDLRTELSDHIGIWCKYHHEFEAGVGFVFVLCGWLCDLRVV